ncbi:hypothetical protein PV08_11747 [Exophiala spinifera]|uniref:Bromo domain-containing protein n=1 Tax=Exophiala spinifera TaxID=91928 RepID=A0A0D1Y4X3_9EURO|nr:uncharacterized protein PV08_11747 [Exophiala spinifera]KIW09971.1 hypothetical protein PV08_11747 [Exophiala spinifera]
MPSLKAYTPYETLAFCQSVARHGSDTSAFEDIAKSLNSNHLIRESDDYDQTRLTAAALEGLYRELLVEEKKASRPSVDGDDGNPRKRKLSASPPPLSENHDRSEEELLQSLVEKLYARFREQTIEEIRLEEEAYRRIESEIAELEKKIEEEQQQQASGEGKKAESGPKDVAPRPSDAQSSPDAAAAQLQAGLDASRADQASKAVPSPTTVRVSQPPPSTASPATPRAIPPAEPAQPPKYGQAPRPTKSAQGVYPRPSPQRQDFAPNNPPYPPQGYPVQMVPPVHGNMPPPVEYPGTRRSPSGQGRGSPVHMPQQQFAAYPGYQQPWPHHPPQNYPPPPYPNGYYPYGTPQNPQYQMYHGPPVQWTGQPPAQVWQHPPYPPPTSANVTPAPRSTPSQQLTGRSSTRWKRRSDSTGAARKSSPVRPSERDVSPISDVESPSRSAKVGKSAEKNDNLLSAQDVRGRRGASVTPGVDDSRSQSLASFTSETPTEKRRRGRPPSKIKAEPPSTPAPIPSDTEPQVATSRGRPQKGTVTSRTDQVQTAVKRKRSPGRDLATPPLPSPRRAQTPRGPSDDVALVSVSKNFSKTAQLLMNEITSHKLAGIFAKPLSERDAPGYKDLVFRPQDLKSVKAAISKGGKAALAAIEALEAEDKSGQETPTKNAPVPSSETGERSLGNGMYLVKKSEDLTPPKGIVNSSQLEMELVRMFANAVMFNPLPTSERGFGRSLRPRKRGGDVVDVDVDVGADVQSRSSSEGSPMDEGGIISDAREMFEDVMASVRKWREVEIERLGGAGDDATGSNVKTTTHGHGGGNTNARQSSVSSALNDDDAGGDSAAASTPVPASGTARKRRRIAD